MRNLELHYQLLVHEPSGLLVLDTLARPAHSFTKQFHQILFNLGMALSIGAPVAVTNTSGASQSTLNALSLKVTAATGTSSAGVQVGTGTAAESINDTALQTQIAHGTGSGQLQYGTVTFGAPSTTATTTTFRVTRVFTNGSGGTVTVQEIGLASSQNNPANQYLLIRDLTGAVAVNNGQQLTVNYDLTTTI